MGMKMHSELKRGKESLNTESRLAGESECWWTLMIWWMSLQGEKLERSLNIISISFPSVHHWSYSNTHYGCVMQQRTGMCFIFNGLGCSQGSMHWLFPAVYRYINVFRGKETRVKTQANGGLRSCMILAYKLMWLLLKFFLNVIVN